MPQIFESLLLVEHNHIVAPEHGVRSLQNLSEFFKDTARRNQKKPIDLLEMTTYDSASRIMDVKAVHTYGRINRDSETVGMVFGKRKKFDERRHDL